MENANTIRCPKCRHEFELSAVMREQMDADVRAEMAKEFETRASAAQAAEEARMRAKDDELADAKSKLAEVASKEAELLKHERELEAREQNATLDLERRLVEERKRIREQEAGAAQERFSREADERVRMKEEQLADAQSKLAAAAAKEAELLKMQRELADKEQQLELNLEQRLVEEKKRIREHETKAAEEKFAREADERVRAKDEQLAEARTKLADAATREADLLRKQRELADKEQQLEVAVEQRLAEATQRIRDQEKKTAEERFAREADDQVRAKQEQLEAAQAKLAAAVAREAGFLKKERELVERERQLEVEKERAIAEETAKVRQQEAKLAEERAALRDEQQRLRDEEQRQQVSSLERTIVELTRKLHQGSQQVQGEAQEVVLRDQLTEAFRADTIEDVAKGVNGADVLHRVRTADGGDAGAIVWESKRTKNWSDVWLPKVRDDQRAAGAAIAIIVTQSMPEGVRHFGVLEGVWVCAPPYAIALGLALRGSLLEIAAAKRAAEGSGQKMQLLYDYLTGTEFRNRVEGLVEAFVDMREDLESERRAMLTRWKRRDKHLERALTNITAFYGDLQGIAGRKLRDLPPLALEIAALPEPSAEPLDDAALKAALYALVPEDGSGIGNGTLSDIFTEHALVEFAVQVTGEDYERYKETLIAEGRLRRGKGKGGSVCRVVASAVEEMA